MDTETVSGYSNYETFHVAMFLSNNREQHEACRNMAQVALRFKKENAGEAEPVSAEVWLEHELRASVEDSYLRIDDKESACRSDSDYLAHSLLTAALGRVNWRELAEEWLGHAQE